MTLEHGLSSDAVEKHRVRYGKNELPTDPGVCVVDGCVDVFLI